MRTTIIVRGRVCVRVACVSCTCVVRCRRQRRPNKSNAVHARKTRRSGRLRKLQRRDSYIVRFPRVRVARSAIVLLYVRGMRPDKRNEKKTARCEPRACIQTHVCVSRVLCIRIYSTRTRASRRSTRDCTRNRKTSFFVAICPLNDFTDPVAVAGAKQIDPQQHRLRIGVRPPRARRNTWSIARRSMTNDHVGRV